MPHSSRGLAWIRAAAVFALGGVACGWGTGSCPLAYSSLGDLPVETADMECTVTITGPAGQAIYDCPPPQTPDNVACTPEGAAPLEGVGRELGGGGGDISVAFSDAGPTKGASAMAGFLGGTTFSYSVSCGGDDVLQKSDQEMQPLCPD